jgi:hypothetical protein
VVERTSAWHNAHKKLVWCTERVGRVIDFWVAFSSVVIIVRRLIREGWRRYRSEGEAIPTTVSPIDGASKGANRADNCSNQLVHTSRSGRPGFVYQTGGVNS